MEGFWESVERETLEMLNKKKENLIIKPKKY
jgi:hypothetical protein